MISRRNTAHPRVARDREVLVELERERGHVILAWLGVIAVAASLGLLIAAAAVWP